MIDLEAIRARLDAKPCDWCKHLFCICAADIPEICKKCHFPPPEYHREWKPNEQTQHIAALLAEVERLKGMIGFQELVEETAIENEKLKSEVDRLTKENERIRWAKGLCPLCNGIGYVDTMTIQPERCPLCKGSGENDGDKNDNDANG